MPPVPLTIASIVLLCPHPGKKESLQPVLPQ